MSASSSERRRDVPGSVFRLEYDHDLGCFGLVRGELRRILIVPTGKVYNLSCMNSQLRSVGGFHNI